MEILFLDVLIPNQVRLLLSQFILTISVFHAYKYFLFRHDL